jgi:uncharacterized protein (TIGR00375 family)
MRVIADLQIHSKYARATSKDLSVENLEKYARIKGIDLLGTGDFQHPLHRKELDAALTEDDKGILRTKTGFPFIWQTEVSLMFSQGGKRRAVHLLIYAPNTKLADKITEYLGSKGRLDYDGRPIFGMTCRNLVMDLKKIDDRIEIIPAHCMTPFFGLYGSKSGFDSLQECFLDMSDKIYAIESGMSADPGMLWRFKEKVNVVSFSDLHSFWPWRLGREATILDIPELSYDNIIKAIRTGVGLIGTIETPPAYGKYHWDGHRDCNFSSSPAETKRLKGICPVCNKPLIIGVDYRVEEIAKEPAGYKPEGAKIYYDLVPLHELISFIYKTPMAGKKAWATYDDLIDRFGNELKILMEVDRKTLAKADPKLVDIIIANREGKLKIKPGYDGVYGQVEFSEPKTMESGPSSQKKLI